MEPPKLVKQLKSLVSYVRKFIPALTELPQAIEETYRSGVAIDFLFDHIQQKLLGQEVKGVEHLSFIWTDRSEEERWTIPLQSAIVSPLSLPYRSFAIISSLILSTWSLSSIPWTIFCRGQQCQVPDAWWLLQLKEFDITFVTPRGLWSQALYDILAQFPLFGGVGNNACLWWFVHSSR